MRTTKGATWAIAGALVVCAAVVLGGVLRGRMVPPPDGGEIQKSRTEVQEPRGGKLEAARRPDVDVPHAQWPATPRAREVDHDRTEMARSGAYGPAVTASDDEENRRDPRSGVFFGEVEEVAEAVQDEVEATTDLRDGDRSGALVGQVVEAEQQPEDLARAGVLR